MEVYLLAVGKVREKFLLDGIEEYAKRLRPYIKLEIREGTEEKVPEDLTAGRAARIR
ncbi:MAG: 23S rRNA (pseudouridine(1915)-N(3))-methyltransferase RlmH, partial [Moorellaceae bacterium]